MMDIDHNVTQPEFHDDQQTQTEKKPTKRISKHSKLRRFCPNLRTEHGCRTKRLLSVLMRRHNWKQASGVLSALLQGTCREKFPLKNRDKYRVAMELLNKVSSDRIEPKKVEQIYDVWIRKNGPMKKWPPKDRYSVPLELALFCFVHGNKENTNFLHGNKERAKQIIEDLMKVSGYKNEPVLNMMAGLIFYELWYASIPEDLKLGSSDIYDPQMRSEISGMELYNQVEYSDFCTAGDVEDVDSPGRCDSECSVGNYKERPTDSGGDMPEPVNQAFKPQGLYKEESVEMTGNEGAPGHNQNRNLMNASIFIPCGLDANLFPIRLPDLNENVEGFIEFYMELCNEEYYAAAVNYLRSALSSTPPVMASLLPLIQLLVLGDQVQEALNVLGNLCHNSIALLPLRLRAILLECFDSKQSSMLSSCYEEILKKDPTCNRSLTRLITLNKNGDYDLESLTEMIALHLDATYAESSVWEEFASCFLKFLLFEEDQMSVNVKANEGVSTRYHASFNTIPTTFVRGKSRKSWKLRCRWWSTRHFSKKAHILEMEAGDMQLSTMKAACASHLYGPEVEYVASVHSYLEEQEDGDTLLFLQSHMKNSLKILENLNRKD